MLTETKGRDTVASNDRILMIVANHYPQDIRVRREADALTEAGYSVTVLALKSPGQNVHEVLRGVTIYRIPEITIFEKTQWSNAGLIKKVFGRGRLIGGYILEYAYFTSIAFLASLYIAVRHGVDVIHAHNPPDTLALIGMFYRMVGKSYVFDHHDLSPELYLARAPGKPGLIYKGLMLFEWLSCRFANMIISTNESYRQIEIARNSVKCESIFIVRNNPIIADCVPNGVSAGHDRPSNVRPIVLFLGSINPQDGVDILMKAMHHLVFGLGEHNVLCRIVGDGDSLGTARVIAKALGLVGHVEFRGMVSNRDEVKQIILLSDIGVEPAPANKANENSTFIKVMEFMAGGLPIVAFDLKETRYSADGAARFVQPGDIEGFALAIKELIDDPVRRVEMGKTGVKRIENELSWEKAAQCLRTAYASLNNRDSA